MTTLSSLPLSLQRGRCDKTAHFDHQSIPKGQQFALMTSYQTTVKQKCGLMLSFIFMVSSIVVFPRSYEIYRTVLFIFMLLSSLLLIPYYFGIFDHSEKWLSFLLIINKNVDEKYVDNKVYLLQESTQTNYRTIAILENITFADIEIIKNNINSFTIKIKGVVFNNNPISNRRAATFVNEVMNFLYNNNIATANRVEFEKVSKGKCKWLGCDVCGFNGCSMFIMLWFMSLSILFVAVPTNDMHHTLCNSSNKLNDDTPTYSENISDGDSNYMDDECDPIILDMIIGWKIFWGIGILPAIIGVVALYQFKHCLLIIPMIYSVLIAIVCQIIIFVADADHLFNLFNLISFVVQAAEFMVLLKTYKIMRTAITVSDVNNAMNERMLKKIKHRVFEAITLNVPDQNTPQCVSTVI